MAWAPACSLITAPPYDIGMIAPPNGAHSVIDNVDFADAPMDRKPGGKPALNEAEIRDVIAFLQPLTDGYSTTAGGPRTHAR